MKNIVYFLLLVSVLFSCSEKEDCVVPYGENKAIVTDVVENHVEYKAVQTLVSANGRATRGSKDSEVNIICLEDEKHDTLLYACDMPNGGWTIYSSDTRVPAIVAYSEKGSLEEDMHNEALMAWLDCTMEDMKVIKSACDEDLKFSKEEIQNNREFWKSVTNVDEYVKEKSRKKETRAPIFGIIDEYKLYGHYELYNSYVFVDGYDSIDALIDTNWNQGYPYNSCCPYLSDGSGRVPAGCVAIAGSQMLNFLHKKYGVPEMAPSSGVLITDATGYVHFVVTQTSRTIWDSYENTFQNVAPLVADVGSKLRMQYGDSVSLAQTSLLVDSVFAKYGIACSYSLYDPTIVKQQLLNGMPLIVGAQPPMTRNSGNKNNVGHTFIFDKYKRAIYVTRNTYRWVFDREPIRSDGTRVPIPSQIEDKIEYLPPSSEICMVGFNWGDFYYYDVNRSGSPQWFSLVGDWINQRDSTVNYSCNRELVYGFEVMH